MRQHNTNSLPANGVGMDGDHSQQNTAPDMFSLEGVTVTHGEFNDGPVPQSTLGMDAMQGLNTNSQDATLANEQMYLTQQPVPQTNIPESGHPLNSNK